VDRRSFLKGFIKSFFGFLGLIYIGLTALFVYPQKVRKKKIQFFKVTETKNLPRKGVKTYFFRINTGERSFTTKVFIVNHKDRLFALSPVCTHLGCLVNWNYLKEQFLCPCHGGRYDIQGNVVGGPPPRPLTRLPMKIKDKQVYVGLKV